MAFINGLKPIPIEQISLINLNEFENFQHCRSKPETEPVEAVGIENVNNLPNSRRLSLSKL
jgi:hypothetical protein